MFKINKAEWLSLEQLGSMVEHAMETESVFDARKLACKSNKFLVQTLWNSARRDDYI